MEKGSAISSCNICGSDTEEIYSIHYKYLTGFKDDDYIQKINICNNCGFSFVSNPFSEYELERRYTNLSKYEGSISIDNFIENQEYIQRANFQFDFINNCIIDYKSVLDIGASTGYSLSLYKEFGCEVFGIEPSESNEMTAKKVYGVNYYKGMFDSYIMEYPDKQYDLIFLSHILEHIVNPMDFMGKISSINRRYIFIEVPALECKYVNEPFGHFCDEHVNYFTYESLYNLMTRLGYEAVQFCMNFGLYADSSAGYPSLMTLWKKSKSMRNKFKTIINTKQYLNAYIKDSTLRYKEIIEKIDSIDDNLNLAVWGTGNHTSKIFAMTNISKKNIVKFYDNDFKKHSYKINDKPIEQFSIDDIKNGTIDRILISTFTAQRAILKELEQYNIKDKLILLYD